MPRRYQAPKRRIEPDTRYNSVLVARLINNIMRDGKKSVATRILYDAMDIVAKKGGDVEPLEVFEKAVNNVKPMIEVRSKRVGGSSYQVPTQVSSRRQQSLAFRWILQSARGKKGKPMCERLASELLDAYNKTGGAITMRENVHRMADANKAFAHFAW